MPVKTTGAEFKRYYEDPVAWPSGQWHDCDIIEVDGVHNEDGVDPGSLDDGASVVIRSGYVIGNDGESIGSLESHFKKWRKNQNTSTLVIECPKEKADEIRALIAKSGAKCLG